MKKYFGIVDAAIVFNKLFFCHLVFYLSRVQVGCQHDDGISEHVRCVSTGKQPQTKSKMSSLKIVQKREFKIKLPRIALAVTGGKLLHEPIDLLSFARQPETFKKVAQGTYKVLLVKVKQVYIRVHHLKG